MSKVLTLKNYFLVSNQNNNLEGLVDWLSRQKLHGKMSRYRTRFIKMVQDRLQEIGKERKQILDDVAEKDEKGKIIFLDEDGKETTDQNKAVNYKMSPKNKAKASRETNDYMEEDYKIDVTAANRDTIYGVREILQETKEEFAGMQATLYDEIVSAFEDIKKPKKK